LVDEEQRLKAKENEKASKLNVTHLANKYNATAKKKPQRRLPSTHLLLKARRQRNTKGASKPHTIAKIKNHDDDSDGVDDSTSDKKANTPGGIGTMSTGRNIKIMCGSTGNEEVKYRGSKGSEEGEGICNTVSWAV